MRTIEDNFGVRIDHYVDVDFCAFKKMVEVVGGVKVPFAYPTRDRYSGLNVTEPGCVTFTGDAALAYVRSRHYEYKVDGEWEDDISSDFGRIARQQDFIRRALQKALDRGARQPLVANQLIDAALSNVTVDSNLTVGDMYDLATRLRAFDPNTVKTYRIDGAGVIIGGASVIQPDINSKRARAILDYFRGEAGNVDESAAPTTSRATSGDDGDHDEPGRSTTTTSGRATTTTPRLDHHDQAPASRLDQHHGGDEHDARRGRAARRLRHRHHPARRPHLPLSTAQARFGSHSSLDADERLPNGATESVPNRRRLRSGDGVRRRGGWRTPRGWPTGR